MATADQVRGLKGTITKLQQEIVALEDRLENVIKGGTVLEDERMAANQRVADLEHLLKRADEAAAARKAQTEQLQKELERSRASELEAWNKLRASEAERNRLNGYIQRVAEDDAAREGNVEVADSRSVPRRPAPPLSLGPDYTYPADMYGGAMTEAVSSGRRRY